MTKSEFDFGDDAVAKSYDDELVPILFIPWAKRLIEEHQPWQGKQILDLASGTGVVPSLLAPNVGPDGRITAVDINPQMLSMAKQRCADWVSVIDFKEGSAEAIDLEDNSMDIAICQQGFQFFPDKEKCSQEIYRILKPSGRAVISTWCPVSDNRFFEILCESLEEIGEKETADLMRLPFDFMPKEDLEQTFTNAGFSEVTVTKQQMDLTLEGGVETAIRMTYATPIAPKLVVLDDSKQSEFKSLIGSKVTDILVDGTKAGTMSTNVVSAIK